MRDVRKCFLPPEATPNIAVLHAKIRQITLIPIKSDPIPNNVPIAITRLPPSEKITNFAVKNAVSRFITRKTGRNITSENENIIIKTERDYCNRKKIIARNLANSDMITFIKFIWIARTE